MHENEPRNHDWLIRYANQKVAPSPRATRYLAGILAVDRPLGLEELLAGKVDRARAYHLSRGGAALIGRKAFLFRTPGTPHYRNPAVVEEILNGLRVFQSRQTREGDFAMGDAWAAYLPHHSHAWRLEPMIWARIWLEGCLSDRDKSWIDSMLLRAARRQLWFARQSPNDVLQYCNRGVVWCAVTTLAGLYFDDPKFLREVNRHAERILTHTLTPRGEVLENYLHYDGGGPDLGYSYTTWIYAVMFRLLSGRADWDDRFIQCQKWAALYLTHSGYALAPGASVRHAAKRAWVCDILPGFEFFSDREPYFNELAGRFLGSGVEHGQGHCLHPFIWSMISHRPHKAVPAPAWYRDHESHYEHQPTQYSLIHHDYQTGVVWRGLHPLKGLQSFALGDEEPILASTPHRVSTVRTRGFDTAATNIEAGPSGWELFRRTGGPGDGYEPESPATVMLSRKGRLWECYVFTPASVIVAVGGQPALRLRWALHALPGSGPQLKARERRVTFKGRKGCLAWLRGTGCLLAKQDAAVLELKTARGPALIGLGGADLRLNRYDGRAMKLHFRDSSGRYTLFLGNILNEAGHLDRSPKYWNRLLLVGRSVP